MVLIISACEQMLAVLALVFVPVMAQVGLHSEFSEHARFVNARNTSWRTHPCAPGMRAMHTSTPCSCTSLYACLTTGAEVPTRFTTVAQVKQLCGSKRAAQR